MIIFRYMVREVMSMTFAVAGALLLISMSARFIKYLGEAAAGDFAVEIIFQILWFRIPGFAQLILPLGFFFGLLMAYGRLYLDSEMTVLSSCGFSHKRLLGYTLVPAGMVALLVATISLWLAPAGMANLEQLFSDQAGLTEFDTLAPRRFQSLASGARVTYTEDLNEDKTLLQNVFISEHSVQQSKGEVDSTITVADTGYIEVEANEHRYLVLENGKRYRGTPGLGHYRVIEYQEFRQRFAAVVSQKRSEEIESVSTTALFGRDDSASAAELQWRFSLPIMVLVIAIIAVPLSQVNPRQGRFAKLLPALLCFVLYLGAIIWARKAVEDEEIAAYIVVLAIHLGFLGLALGLNKKALFGSRRAHSG